MRKSMHVVVFLAFMDGAAVMLEESGVGDTIGIDTGMTAGDALSEAMDSAGSLSAGGGSASTLYHLFNSVAKSFQAVFEAATAAPQMFMAIGVPGWVVAFLFGPMVLIIGADIYYALTGRDI